MQSQKHTLSTPKEIKQVQPLFKENQPGNIVDKLNKGDELVPIEKIGLTISTPRGPTCSVTYTLHLPKEQFSAWPLSTNGPKPEKFSPGEYYLEPPEFSEH